MAQIGVAKAKDKDIEELDAFIDSLTDEEIDELNADYGEPLPPIELEEFLKKENIRI